MQKGFVRSRFSRLLRAAYRFVFVLLVLFVLALAGCKKKEDVIPISEKQKLVLGKWRQAEVYAPNGSINILESCEQTNNTVFELKSNGKCDISSAGNCVSSRTTTYAFSADGEVFAIDGFFYYVQSLDNDELRFSSEINGAGFRQVWKRVK